MAKIANTLLLLFLFTSLFACSPVISGEVRKEVAHSITFEEVARNPEAYKGKIVLWGGRIIQALPQNDGTTLIEVLDWPLGWYEEPRETVSFRGRFLVLLKEPLDLSGYERGTRITIAGEVLGSIQGEKIKSVSDSTYRYPLILNKQVHVWKGKGYQYSTYEPKVYDPSYDPNRGAGILRY